LRNGRTVLGNSLRLLRSAIFGRRILRCRLRIHATVRVTAQAAGL
jgi:hypothetical protein